MTYNVHYGIGRDGRYRLDRVIEVIKGENPDVVALQEVDKNLPRTNFDDQIKIIADALGMNCHYCINCSMQNGELRMATLSRFQVEENRRHDISFCTRLKVRNIRPRCIFHTDIVAGSTRIHLFNAHLGLGVRERVHQRGRLLSSAILLDEKLKDPIVIVGDFNDKPISVVHSRFQSHFNDAFKLANGRRKDAATFCWGPLRLKLDHIYVSEKLKPTESYVVNTPLSRIASDHMPLVATVEVKI
ncbi:MAG TPA: endonuclease/exonuclease/phosphatase family protein [Thermodesulfobacteriota bacterium]|nr:endonuclease/exonuclease/phosphatase family protein [Thermodesulfobacteriota bacterium]